jgi:hypothetical protein
MANREKRIQDPSVNQEHQQWKKEFRITMIDNDSEQPHPLEESPLRASFQQNTGQMTPQEMNDLLNAASGERSDAEVQAEKQQGMDALMKEIGAVEPEQSFQSPEAGQGRLADGNLNYTAPDTPQVPATTEGKQLSTLVDGGQNLTLAAGVPNNQTNEALQNFQPPEGKQNNQYEGNLNYTPTVETTSNKTYNGDTPDAKGYSGGNSDTQGYNSGYSDSRGYDEGYPDAHETPERGGEGSSNL